MRLAGDPGTPRSGVPGCSWPWAAIWAAGHLYCSRALLCLTETNELSASRLDAPRRTVEILVLSPLGVLSQFQNRGIGTRLVEHALAAADAHRAPLVFLEGSPYYYAKRGFERADEIGVCSPSPVAADGPSHRGHSNRLLQPRLRTRHGDPPMRTTVRSRYGGDGAGN
ncbi:GNAT family N-acetyltransferase [Actinacidiphila soli]|uniref:GNAT family N-acetyltransferase n=1 Tax=Actinacidiphila soli TaxID=2487275 RepID=UPI000FCB30FF|nr:GNAT family N-acetyltransferase [Actinacidiphila soli]